jgi:hypothetical protein
MAARCQEKGGIVMLDKELRLVRNKLEQLNGWEASTGQRLYFEWMPTIESSRVGARVEEDPTKCYWIVSTDRATDRAIREWQRATIWARLLPDGVVDIEFKDGYLGTQERLPIGAALREFSDVLDGELRGDELDEDRQKSLKTKSSHVRVPSQPKRLKEWRVRWRTVKGEWDKGKDYEEIIGWLVKSHPNLACSVDTLRATIQAGEAGELD